MTDNSKHLIAFNKQATEDKIEAVKEAVSFCMYNSEEVNFNKIARKAMVSRVFIYNRPELRALVENSKSPSKVRAEKKRISDGRARSEESKTMIIGNLKKRLSVLTKELDRAKGENAKLRAYIEEIDN